MSGKQDKKDRMYMTLVSQVAQALDHMNGQIEKLYATQVEIARLLVNYCPFCHEKTELKEVKGMIVEGVEPQPEQKVYCKKCDKILFN